jgi:hypothetical protein
MARPGFVVIAATDATTLQEEVRKLALQLGEICLGRVLEGVTVGSTQTTIPHGLGRMPISCLALPRADARVWRPTKPDGTNIYLQANTSVVCDVWVFG